MPCDAFTATDVRFRGYVSAPWSLCIGAGIGAGIIPNWLNLTRLVVNREFRLSFSESEFHKAVVDRGWGLDAWIQSALNSHIANGGTESSFAELLSEELYGDLLDRSRAHGLDRSVRTALNIPKYLKREEAVALVEWFDKEYGSTTLVQMAKLLAVQRKARKMPASIITLNADSLLYSLMAVMQIVGVKPVNGIYSLPKDMYKRVLRSSQQHATGIPIVHVHGCLAPNPGKKAGLRRADSREKLIFDEGAYLRLAGDVANWPQVTFLSQAQSRFLVFVGHSMADPNIRKWLGWSCRTRRDESIAIGGWRGATVRALWITKRPPDAQSQSVLSKSLIHLGVRIAWVNDWSEVPAGLANVASM